MRTPVALLVLMLACGLCWAQDAAELELDHSVNSELVSPHTDWATPYALGKTRVLFFVRGHNTDPREVIELKERFDLDPQMVYWRRLVDTTIEQWHGDEVGIRRMAKLLSQKWDAFVFIDVAPEKVPIEQQYPLIKAITDGAGLVLVGVDDKRVLKDKNRLKALPGFLGDVAGATAFTVRNGRGVRLPARQTIPYSPGWEVAYDEWDMRLGKAILWAAGKEPKLELTFTPSANIPPPAPPTAAPKTAQMAGGAFTWTAPEPLADLVFDTRLRREDGLVIDLADAPAAKSASHGEYRTETAAGAGSYYYDVIARSKRGVEAFGSIPVTVRTDRALTISVDNGYAEPGGKLTGTVTIGGPASAGDRLTVSLRDRRDREIARQACPIMGDTASFAFAAAEWYPMLVEVRASLVQGTQETAYAWQFARITHRHRNQFNFVMWDVPGGSLAPVAEESLRRSGITIHLGGSPDPPVYLAAYDMAWIPYTVHIDAKLDEKGVMKPFCWNDLEKVQPHVEKLAEKYLPARKHGVFVYSLGDEISVRGSCLSPFCLAAYRRYLQEQYGDIAALNASWGTTFGSFDDVQLSKPDDDNEAEALRSGNFPRWYDRQAFQSYNFCKYAERYGRAYRANDPLSKTGFEGAGTFRDGDDLDGFVRSNSFWSPYPGTADEVLRSIAPRDFPRSNWMGYTKDPDSLLEKYWRMITRGCDSVWWWRWDVLGRFHGWLNMNLDPFPTVKEILRDTQIVRDGLGDLLLHSEMQTDGIGIIYSQPSAYAAKVQNANLLANYEQAHSGWHAALRELGLNFHYFTDRQLRLGEINLSKYRVVLLPFTQALSAKECEALRQYVRNGGTLIADIRPGIYDGHVKPLAAGQLDDVFGVKRTGCPDPQQVDGSLKVPVADGKLEPLDVPKVRADAGVTATTATAAGAAGSVPLLLTNEFGKGRAILLNMPISSFPPLNAPSTPELAATLLRTLLGQGGVTPAVALADEKGQRVRNVEVTRWMNGPVQLISVFRHQGLAEPATLDLRKPLYVYDLKNHKSLGRQQAVKLTITPYRAEFFAVSPQPLSPVDLKVATSAAPGTVQQVQLATRQTEGTQAVKLQVKLPDGRVADWVDPVAVVGQGGAGVAVPVALNDPAGTWTVTATELYTGKSTSAQFSVK